MQVPFALVHSQWMFIIIIKTQCGLRIKVFFFNLTTCKDGPIKIPETRQGSKQDHPTMKNSGKERLEDYSTSVSWHGYMQLMENSILVFSCLPCFCTFYRSNSTHGWLLLTSNCFTLRFCCFLLLHSKLVAVYQHVCTREAYQKIWQYILVINFSISIHASTRFCHDVTLPW